MVFSSLVFLFRFLPFILLLYYIVPVKAKNLILLLGSLFFYAWGEPFYVILIVFSILLDYTVGRALGKCQTSGKRKLTGLCLGISLVGNLGLLMTFKYANFFIISINQIFSTKIDTLSLSLPIGISFYTFQTLSYTIDVYRKKVAPQKNLLFFATYVSLFPQLIAGPIVRYQTVEAELKERHVSMEDFAQGAFRFSVGLAKKVLLANTIGNLFADIGRLPAGELTTFTAWIGVLAFTFQIYFDFSGYSDMAIGLGRMFGFHFLENFDHPYESSSVTEFWRRWHISLGSWFREYVYIPLGGNKNGIFRQIINIGIVWLLTGLWHGASWNFVLWGIYYGILLILEKTCLLRLLKRLPDFLGHIYTMMAVIGGWALFCICDVAKGWEYGWTLLGQGSGLWNTESFRYLCTYGALFFIGIIASTSLPAQIGKKVKGYRIWCVVWMTACLFMSLAFLLSDTYNPFLYFRF